MPLQPHERRGLCARPPARSATVAAVRRRGLCRRNALERVREPPRAKEPLRRRRVLCRAAAVGREVQIIVMCSSNEKLFEHYTPPITAVDLRFRDACQMAMHLAMDIATGRASYPQDISIRPVMIYRQSCPM